MSEIIWNECSCCGSMRTGVIEYPDGEQIRITEFVGSGVASAIAYRGGLLNSESSRITGGELIMVDVTIISTALGLPL